MMKYWHYRTFEDAMDQGYLNAMMLNACIPSYDDKGTGSGGSSASGRSISFFELGEQIAGLK
ncbi:hypothetical protein H7F33_14275 [Pedobacter sp. PAMC26386]|nr:hypothetical protein H7F33_14275 [Pedobacter sp. PAMC26386]